MSRYAAKTEVSSSKSRDEIEKILVRYGAGQFIYGWDQDRAVVGFTMADRQVKFILPMPDRNSREITHTPTGKTREENAQIKEYEQLVKQKWRALSLVIKAKLEAVESGITEFEDEFLAHIVLPGGETVGTFMKPQIKKAYLSGTMPKLLPAPNA